MSRILAMVVGNKEIMPATHVVRLRVGPIGGQASPGQFLHIRCGDGHDPLLRRPMSVYRTEGDVIEILVRTMGKGSAWLNDRRIGDELDCLGPQGRGFRLDPMARHLLFVGGGHGVAPLIGLAEQALAKGSSVTLAVGASTASLVFPAGLLPAQVEYLVATDDGSAGYRGMVTDLVEDWLGWADAIYGYGQTPTVEALADKMQRRVPRKPGQVALEERMACSTGACLSCMVEMRRGQLRACVDGPVFDIYQVAWDQRTA